MNRIKLHIIHLSHFHGTFYVRFHCVNVEQIEPQRWSCDLGYKCECRREWNGRCFGICVKEFSSLEEKYANVLDI